MIIAKEGHMPFLLYPLLRADLPPIQRLAAGGEIYAQSECAQWPPSAAGDCRCPPTGGRRAHGEGQKGARAPYGSLAPS